MMPTIRPVLAAAAAAVLVAVPVLVAAPPPAHAFLDGLFGGGSDGGACAGSDGGLVSLVASLAGDGPLGIPVGAAGLTGPDLGQTTGAGGCPVVETAPFAVQGIVADQEQELLRQSDYMVTQIRNMEAMRQLAGFDSAEAIAGGITAAHAAAAMVPRVLWSLPAENADFQALYPYDLPAGMTVAQLTALEAEQARVAREASRASKLVTADAVTGIEAYPERTDALMEALKACDGQTCAIDTGVQAALLEAEIGSRLLLIEAAHDRANEAQLDQDQAAIERARQQTLLAWQGLDQYGGSPGS